MLFWFIVLLYFSVYKRTYFVISYFLYLSSFVGFVSNSLILGGVEYGHFFINIIALYSMFLSLNKIRKVRIAILFFIIFYIYGLVKPVLDGNQGLIDSVKASKSFSFYFFVMYMINFFNKINYLKVAKFLLVVSVYFSFIYIINNLFQVSIAPPIYKISDGVACSYVSFISFSVVYVNSSFFVASRIKKISLSLFLLVGLWFAEFFNIFLTTVMIFIYLHFRNNKLLLLLLSIPVGLIFIIICWEYIINIYEVQKIALDSRSALTEFRWSIIDNYLWGGCGFLYSTSELMRMNVSDSVLLNTFSFIDAGYVDLLGRFGLIGTAIFLTFPIAIILKNRNITILHPYLLFILQFFLVNVTWSVFTYAMGISLLAIVYGLIYQIRSLPSNKNRLIGL